jgi:uncharacterized membrane protein
MLTVSIRGLTEAIREADAFALPEMNAGTGYLYETVYRRMSKGHDVRLSELDFDAFEPEDIELFSDLYDDVFERNCCSADGIAGTLRAVAPVCNTVGYV